MTSLHSRHNDLCALRNAILAFANEHRSRPFGVLREIGVQAALKRLVDSCLNDHATVEATLVNEDGVSIQVQGKDLTVNTLRVRLESKILPSDGSSNFVAKGEGKSDA